MPDMATPERDVLTSLPNTRPTRRSSKRDASAAAAKPRTAKPAARKAAASKPKATAAAQATAKPRRTNKTTAKGSKVGVPKGQSAPKKKAAEPAPLAPGTIPAAGWATNEPAPKKQTTGGFNTDDLFGTAMTAVSEIAQIGLASISQNAKSLLDRLPRR